MSTKETNPKDAVGVRKWRQFTVVPLQVTWEVGVGMLEGALKYGRHNYRHAGVRASVYYDAARGHLDQWFEGEDVDPDSSAQLSHVTKAICSLYVLRDAMMNDFLVDDRPPRIKNMVQLREKLQRDVDMLFQEHGHKDPHHFTLADGEAPYRGLANEWNAAPADVLDEEVLGFVSESRALDNLTDAVLDQFPGSLCPADYKALRGEVEDCIEMQPRNHVRLDFPRGGSRTAEGRLTSRQWFKAIPGVRVTELGGDDGCLVRTPRIPEHLENQLSPELLKAAYAAYVEDPTVDLLLAALALKYHRRVWSEKDGPMALLLPGVDGALHEPHGHPKDHDLVEVKLEDGSTTITKWGKASHVPLYGFLIGEDEEFDLIPMKEVVRWRPA